MRTTLINAELSAGNADGAIKSNSPIDDPAILTTDIEFAPGQDMLEVSLVVDTGIPNNLSPPQENPLAQTMGVEPWEPVCIIAEKVFAGCQQRECIPAFKVALSMGIPPFTFIDLSFGNGVIVQPSIIITPLLSHPNYSRLQFTIHIPYKLRLRDSDGQMFTQKGNLPDINKDIVMYYPSTRPEFDLNLRVETRTEIITGPLCKSTTVQLSISSLVVAKVTGPVQLFIPSFRCCPEPRGCEEYQPHNPRIDCLNPDTAKKTSY